jgi:hypothetical protein
MKNFFTLISMALVAISVNAQDQASKEELIEKGALFEAAEITMGDITWKPGNDKAINDEAETIFYPVMGQGNAIEEIYAEEVWTDDQPTGVFRPYYSYIDYEKGSTGLPGFGLYYKFTPTVAGALKVKVWVNKGNRRTCVVPASTGVPFKYGIDYQFEGYVNGQDSNVYPEGHPKAGQKYYTFFTAAEMLERHNNAKVKDGVDTAPFVLEAGNQALWGWITFDVKADEVYYVFQMSSQLGFAGYEFTPTGGEKESYSATSGKNVADMKDEFKSIVDDNGVATNVGTTGRSVVKISTPNMSVEGVGSATPTAVVPGEKITTGIESVKVAGMNVKAPIYNLAGQKVNNDYKGVVIQNGKKFMNK